MRGWANLALALTLAAASPVAAAASRADSPSNSRFKHGCSNYPLSARMDGVQGETILSLHIDRAGRVTDSAVLVSSGSKTLDDAAQECVLGWNYEPTLASGKTVEATRQIRIAWRLNDTYGPAYPPSQSAPQTDLGKLNVPEPDHFSFDEPPVALPDGVKVAGPPHVCTRWYPTRAIREKREGVTGLTFTITPSGTVKDILIVQSSGDTRLDQVSIICTSFWRYRFTGPKREVAWHTSISWKLTE